MVMKRMVALIMVAALCMSFVPMVSVAEDAPATEVPAVPIYQDKSYSFSERAADLVARMTLSQKTSQLVTQGSAAIPELGINRYTWWSEAIHGRSAAGGTMYPVSYAVGSSWDRDLYYKEATEIGNEIREGVSGNNLNLTFFSPTVNLARDPRWGRNDESYSEDAYMSGVMGGQFVMGMEGKDQNGALLDPAGYNKVITTLKHYLANNSERNRLTGGANMDERSLREYYSAQYRDIVKKTDVQSLMTAYSHVNGVPAALNVYILDTLLRQTWGFSGYVVSDCDAVSTIARHQYINPFTGKVITTPELFAQSLMHGNDVECNGGHSSNIGTNITNMSSMLGLETEKGIFTENQVDISVHRAMLARMKLGEFDGNISYVTDAAARKAVYAGVTLGNQTSERLAITEKMGESGIVLLQNNLVAKEGAAAEKLLPLKIPATGAFKIALIGYCATSTFLGGYSADPGANNRVTIQKGIEDAVKAINPEAVITYHKGFTESGTDVNVFYTVDPAAVELAAASDLVLVVAGSNGSTSAEDADRSTTKLPGAQSELISRVGKANKNTVAIMETCGPMEVESFKNDVGAILWSAYAGMRKGVAFANVLFGKTTPSGKVTATWHKVVNDYGETDIPSITDYNLYRTNGSNGRTYMYFNGEVSYPFGYGLSYTSFEYSNLRIDKTALDANDSFKVTFDIKNTGSVKGAEVAQLYVAQPDAAAELLRPYKRLKGFDKVELEPNETKTVTLEVKVPDLAFFNESLMRYAVDTGRYEIQVGKSSADIVLKSDINVTGALKHVPAVVTAKAIQSGDVENDIPERLIFNKGKTINPQVTVAMNDETLYGYIIKGKSKAMPEGMTVEYTSNRPGVVSVAGGVITAAETGVATITAKVTYNGESATGDFVVYVESNAYPEGILIDGAPIHGFDRDNFNYSVNIPHGISVLPTVDFVKSGNPDVTYSVTQIDSIPGIAVLKTTNTVTGKEFTYRVGFGRPPVTTDFKTGAAGPEWNVLNPVPANAGFVAGGLKINTAKTGENGTENIYQQSALGSWVVKTHITLSEAPSARNQQAGVIIRDYDNLNYLKFVYERSTGTANAFRVYKGTGTEAVVAAVSNSNTATVTDMYLQVAKDGNNYIFAFSLDNVNWTNVTTTSATYLLPNIGLFAGNGAYDVASISATYEYLNVYSDVTLSNPTVDTILVNGKQLEGFGPTTFDYNTTIYQNDTVVPVVAASSSNPNFDVVVTQASGLPGAATVVVSSELAANTYTIIFGEKPTSDYMADGTIDDKWTILKSNPQYWSVEKGKGLVLKTQPGDLASKVYTWTSLFTRPAAGDFEVVVKFHLPRSFWANYQQAQVLVIQDDDNFVRVTTTNPYLTHTGVERDGSWVRIHAYYPPPPGPDNTFTSYVYIKKQGNTYVTAQSPDGINFNYFNEDAPFEINLKDPKLALFATKTTANNMADVCYEYVDVLSINGVRGKTFEQSLDDAFSNVARYVLSDIPSVILSDFAPSPVPFGHSVSMVSDKPDVISNDGKVARGAAEEKVNLTVTVTDGTRLETKTIAVTVPKASVETVSAVQTLVAGRAAVVNVALTGPDLSGLKATVFGATKPIVSGAAGFSFTAAQVPAPGSYTIDISDEGGVVVAQAAVNVVAEPAGLWTPVIALGTDSFTVTFGAPITFNEAKKAVKIGEGPALDNALVTFNGAVLSVAAKAAAGQKVLISGVKYAELFPSYSFSFTVTAQ